MADYDNMTREELLDELRKTPAEQNTLACPDGQKQLAHELKVHQVELEMQNDELRRSQQHLEEARDRYADLYDFAPVGYVTLDSKGVISNINLTGAAMLGTNRSYLQGKPFSSWVAKESILAFYQHLQHVFASGRKETSEVTIKCRKDKLFNVSLESVAVARRDGEGKDCWSAIIDITERKKYQQIEYLAYYDQLTGLPNRSLLEDRFNQAITAALRNKTQVALLFLDMDRFKEVNDSLGHAAGDRLLQDTAARLKNSMRKVDTIARLAGDEFIAIIPDLDGGTHAAVVAEHILDILSPPFFIEGHEFSLTHSIGISIFPDDGGDFQTLLKKADAAMFNAKKTGQHSFQFYTEEMHIRAVEAIHMGHSLMGALERDEFALYYQPEVDTTNGRIIGMEALLRWHHPEMGWIPPETFLPVAEERGLIGRIFDWTLYTACAQNRQWQQEGLPSIPIAVNISAVQLRQKGILETIKKVLRDTNLEPRYLELELTEGSIMADPEKGISLVRDMADMGLTLTIDDFGTGYSSLSHLRRFSVSRLKIDRSFIHDITSDPDAAAVVIAIIDIAKNLKMRVIAEGVETEEQMEFLRANRCEDMQGFYLSLPMPAPECGRILQEGWRQDPSVTQ